MKVTQYFALAYMLTVAVVTGLAWLFKGYFQHTLSGYFFHYAQAYLVLVCVLSLITYGVYAKDKRAASHAQRRIPERRLHWLALAGGWPGALLAQGRLHHKSRKQAFKTLLWLTIMLHLLLLALLLRLT